MKMKVKHTNKINGLLKISGSKNAALPIIIASILTKEEVTLYNVPIIDDVLVLIDILNSIGVTTKLFKEKNKLILNAKNINNVVETNLVSKLRASYYLMGALISRKKKMQMNFPGGCNFTNRPIELHLKAFKLMNIETNISKTIKLRKKKDIDSIITFPIITVGGTINTILASVLKDGVTIINNASIEPEVIDTINFINHMGGNIKVKEGRVITIKGVKKLHSIKYKIMFDRIEAGSYLFLTSALSNSEIIIENVDIKKMESVIKVLNNMGCKIYTQKNKIKLISPNKLKGIEYKTGPYPLFPTDLQPILSTTLLNAKDKSKITDIIYEGRNSHVIELQKLQAKIECTDKDIIIYPSSLIGDIVKAHDLRCSFALIIGTSMAVGMSIIEDIDYLYRGYEKIEEKLKKIGLNIEILI